MNSQNNTNFGNSLIYVGQIIHSLSLETIEYIQNGVIVVVNGIIKKIEKVVDNLSLLQATFNIPDDRVFRLSATQFLIPGLIDTHIHGSQYPNAGLGCDLPLLDWLVTYTFPLEKKFSDADFAKTVYEAVVKQTLSSGTTTSCYFATIHADTALILADAAQMLNQRAFVGKVNMTVGTTDDYGETMEESLKKTEEFLIALQDKGIVKPIVTPRFALSCDMETMERLATLAKKFDASIQTHISENLSEVEAVGQMYPDCANYADVYDKAGLLTHKTILAHGVYLTPEELVVLKNRGASISHCPNSNNTLQSGMCPVRHLLSSGLKVGLGTDCSGGYSSSMLDAMRQALATSISVSFSNDKLSRLKLPEVFYLATLGGAEALAIDGEVGNFVVGKAFDAVVVDMASVDLLEEYTLQQLFQKFIYLGDDRNISRVYVWGKLSK